MIPDRLAVTLDPTSWTLPPVMRWLERAAGIESLELARTFNCGLGMVAIVAPEDAARIAGILTEAGETVWTVGRVVPRIEAAPGCTIEGLGTELAGLSMPTLYVARSAGLGQWASDVGLSKHIYKVGVTDGPVKELVTAGWAGFTDWILVKKQELDGDMPDDETVIERLAVKTKMIDPKLYPKIKGTLGIFKVLPAQVENHIVITQALAGTPQTAELKLKPADFAAFLIHNALRDRRRRGSGRSIADHLAVLAHFRRASIHPVLRVPLDALVAAEIAVARYDLVAARRQFGLHRRVEARFHLDRADARRGLARRLRAAEMTPARGVAGFLDVHAEIDDVGQNLDMALRLHVAAHQPEGQERLAVLQDEAGDDGLERAFARRIDVGGRRIERIELAAILEHEAQMIRDQPRAHAAIVRLG